MSVDETGKCQLSTLFYHLYPVNHWHDITRQILGFSDIFDDAIISVAGNAANVEPFIRKTCKCPFELHEVEPSLAEPSSWNSHLLPRIISQPDRTYFYCHTKGVTHPGIPSCQDWRDMMVYFLLERYEDYVVPALPDYGFVGVEKIEGRRPGAGCHCSWFYGGNFWWMNPSKLDRGLLTPLSVWAKKRRGRRHGEPRSAGKIKVFYNTLALEAFPGKFPAECGLCLYHSRLNRYQTRQARTEYENMKCDPDTQH